MLTSVMWSEKRSAVHVRSLRSKKESASSKNYGRRGPLNKLPDDYSKKNDSRSRQFIVGFVVATSRPILDFFGKRASVRNHVRRADASTSDCQSVNVRPTSKGVKRLDIGSLILLYRVEGRQKPVSQRKCRFYLAVPMENRSDQSMESAIQALHLSFTLGTFQTATTDRGKEFSCHERIRDTLGLPMYFADPYSYWQRGSNENANGLLREFFPKGTDFGKVSRSEIAQALD